MSDTFFWRTEESLGFPSSPEDGTSQRSSLSSDSPSLSVLASTMFPKLLQGRQRDAPV